jgi:hypothetical protein
MRYREIIAVCSEIHTKHINTLCGQNVEFLHVKPGGTYCIVTAGLYRFKVSALSVCDTASLPTVQNTASHRSLRKRSCCILFVKQKQLPYRSEPFLCPVSPGHDLACKRWAGAGPGGGGGVACGCS